MVKVFPNNHWKSFILEHLEQYVPPWDKGLVMVVVFSLTSVLISEECAPTLNVPGGKELRVYI